jgi:hypothetical protein
VVSCLLEAFLDGVDSQVRVLENGKQVLLSDRPVGGMYEIPPPTDGLLDVSLRFFTNNQGINQPVNLALYRLIRHRHFLGHVRSGLLV